MRGALSAFVLLLPLAGCAPRYLSARQGQPSYAPSSDPYASPQAPQTSASYGEREHAAGTAQQAPMDSTQPYQTGKASYYGESFRGRKTASGEPFNPDAFTAAHRSLPFGSWVSVRRLDTGAIVRVRITDRGPFIGGRIIDLSRAAGAVLNILRSGTADVALYVETVSR
jgi:rare lipoprotein A